MSPLGFKARVGSALFALGRAVSVMGYRVLHPLHHLTHVHFFHSPSNSLCYIIFTTWICFNILTLVYCSVINIWTWSEIALHTGLTLGNLSISGCQNLSPGDMRTCPTQRYGYHRLSSAHRPTLSYLIAPVTMGTLYLLSTLPFMAFTVFLQCFRKTVCVNSPFQATSGGYFSMPFSGESENSKRENIWIHKYLYNSFRNNTTQSYFTLVENQGTLEFFSADLGMSMIFPYFQQCTWLLDNLWISKARIY